MNTAASETEMDRLSSSGAMYTNDPEVRVVVSDALLTVSDPVRTKIRRSRLGAEASKETGCGNVEGPVALAMYMVKWAPNAGVTTAAALTDPFQPGKGAPKTRELGSMRAWELGTKTERVCPANGWDSGVAASE